MKARLREAAPSTGFAIGINLSIAIGLALAIGLVIAIGLALATPASSFGGPTGAAPGGRSSQPGRTSELADATMLYNAGTIALERGAFGPSVTFLLAAARLEPRSPDIRANLSSALVAAARAGGEEDRPDDSDARPIPISTDEAWWLAGAILAVGAALGLAGAVGRPRVLVRWAGNGLMAAGVVLLTVLQYAAWDESKHPQAVVIVPTLSVERGPEEPSRPAVLLAAGERVSLGAERGGRVEVRLGANRIGWASREGLWRIVDAPRYTSNFQPR